MAERETLEVDALFVGAGPASLGGAIHLSHLIKAHNEKVENGALKAGKLEGITIAVIEKGSEIGSHGLSGAVMDPIALRELIPDFEERGAPLEGEVKEDYLYYLTAKRKIKFPFMPPPLSNHGKYIVSLSKLVRWMGTIAEEAGVNLFPSFPGAELLYDNNSVVGVRTGDKGVNRDGKPKGNYEPGVDIIAKVTVLGEGPRGSLTKKLIEKIKLDAGRFPQVYAIGVKEIWEMPRGSVPPGRVIHTLGYPLKSETFGGGFIYSMKNDLIDIGLVVGLDYRDPLTDPHLEFQRFKQHPYVASLLKGGKLIGYGAKAIPEGGYYSIPQLYADGVLLIGDSAGFLNGQRLKGIHLGIKSGMLAAEAIFQALLKGDYSSRQLSSYQQLVDESWIKKELYPVRNFHSGFENGRWAGLFNAGISYISGGRWPRKRAYDAGHKRMRKLSEYYGAQNIQPHTMKFDGELTFDRLTDVYYSGTAHNEDQPCHLKVLDTSICINRCAVEYGNPCQYFCPAKVYEMVGDGQGRHLQINFSNCVHCKTCDIMDPYQIIDWVPPEGGDGPNYVNM